MLAVINILQRFDHTNFSNLLKKYIKFANLLFIKRFIDLILLILKSAAYFRTILTPPFTPDSDVDRTVVPAVKDTSRTK